MEGWPDRDADEPRGLRAAKEVWVSKRRQESRRKSKAIIDGKDMGKGSACQRVQQRREG